MLLFDCFRTTEKGFLHPLYYVPYWFRCRYYIKWRWTCPTFFKIAYPQSGPSKFPLNICTFLQMGENSFSIIVIASHLRCNRKFVSFHYVCLTDINWYEWFIIAISKFNSTTMFITEYVPNISIPQKRVKILIPSNSKLSKSTNPKTAQNKVCVVSNRLENDDKLNA